MTIVKIPLQCHLENVNLLIAKYIHFDLIIIVMYYLIFAKLDSIANFHG